MLHDMVAAHSTVRVSVCRVNEGKYFRWLLTNINWKRFPLSINIWSKPMCNIYILFLIYVWICTHVWVCIKLIHLYEIVLFYNITATILGYGDAVITKKDIVVASLSFRLVGKTDDKSDNQMWQRELIRY